MLKKFFLPLLIIFLSFPCLVEAGSQASKGDLQKIDGGFAFPSIENKHVYIVRIGVDPGILSKNETSNEAIMKKITVVACAGGICKFTKILPGLGFYETDFKLNNLKNGHFDVLVIACSYLGCVKRSLDVKIIKP